MKRDLTRCTTRIRSGFYTIVAAQFFSSLADSALLIAAIALLQRIAAPEWMQPTLQQTFVVSYVVVAPFAGAMADAMPKGRVMLIANAIKILGCLMMLAAVHPLVAYGVVGFGAAAYSPAKYGILTEFLPPDQLVIANGWIEGTTVASIVFGFGLGGVLVSQRMSSFLSGFAFPGVGADASTAPAVAIAVIAGLYLTAAVFNLFIPDTGVDHRPPSRNPLYLAREFSHCLVVLWRDKIGQISLATTTLFWAAGATLKFVVIAWAMKSLGYDLSQATYLLAVFAIGIGIGASAAARLVSLRRAVGVLPVGAATGLILISMIFAKTLPVTVLLLIFIGACAGFLAVPMNALLQHRGHILVGAGHSIAVQNFNENLGILTLAGLYAFLVQQGISVNRIVVIFGLFVTGVMLLVIWRFQRHGPGELLHLIAEESPSLPRRD